MGIGFFLLIERNVWSDRAGVGGPFTQQKVSRCPLWAPVTFDDAAERQILLRTKWQEFVS